MLQYITQSKNIEALLEEMGKVANSGCAWIQLNLNDVDIEEFKEIADSLVALCKEKEVILTVEDNPTLAQDLGLHGVFMNSISSQEAIALRQTLGAEAIIGFAIKDGNDAIAVANADIDYVSIDSNIECQLATQIIEKVRQNNVSIPIVVPIRDLSLIEYYIKNGANGVALNVSYGENLEEIGLNIDDAFKSIGDALK